MLHSVYHRPGTAGVHAQFDRVLDALARARLTTVPDSATSTEEVTTTSPRAALGS
jgi:hypothetical protein